MKLPSLVVAAALATTLTASLAHAQQPEHVAEAVDAANRWLVLADANDGAATWDQAAPSFKAALPQAGWSNALRQVRQPLGAVKSRTVASSTFTHTLPGAPDGDYVVIKYDTQFDNKAHAVETVVPMRAPDGSWRVSGYFVR